MMTFSVREFILYACPAGAWGQQLSEHLRTTSQKCGDNAAHGYMPHISLTGFFRDVGDAIPSYGAALVLAMRDVATVPADIVVEPPTFDEHFHGFFVRSGYLLALTRSFALHAASSTRLSAIRLKTDLHVSLAYQFERDQAPCLEQAAAHLGVPDAPEPWEVRFYERQSGNHWILHHMRAVPALEPALAVR
jgi:ubiquitin-associated SH3 domain-containing protein